MILERLRLYQFRCYGQAEIEADPRFNVIIGLNGQGKTSLLEAIGLLAFLRSFRSAKNGEMLRLGQPEGLVSGTIQNRGLSAQLAVKLSGNRKQATFNGKACRYLSEYVGRISAVSFSPTDLEIIRGSPENRRLWLDKMAQILDPAHADLAQKYQKVLEHRNRQLKAMAEGRLRTLPDDFEVWTENLVQFGAQLIHNRIHTVDKTGDKIRKYYREISRENLGISIRYSTEIFDGHPTPDSLEIINLALRKRLEAARPKETILGTTLFGPHRDDVEIEMAGNPFRSFGSQGEIRSIVLAMRLTEVEVYRDCQNLSPILLIDDFSSELDARRREFLLNYLLESDSQVFLSTTENLSLGRIFLANDGRIVRNDHGHSTDRYQQL